MKTIIIMLLVISLDTNFKVIEGVNIPSLIPAPFETDSEFKLIRSDEYISIYTRWISEIETRPTRQLKAEFVIDRPSENVISVLRDEKSYLIWMKAIKTYYRLKTINENQWFSYVQFSTPWPLNNQDCILKYEVFDNKELLTTEITLTGEPDYLKPYRGVMRISHMEASWVLTQIEPNKTRVEYYVFSKQAPKFPIWITDPLIQKNLLKTMNEFRKVVLNDFK